MEWYSDEAKMYYELVNKITAYALHRQYENIAFFELGKESFNELFAPNRSNYILPQLDIILCIDFGRYYKTDYSDIGINTLKYATNAFTSLIPDSKIFELNNSYKGFFSKNFYLNKTEYCKGIVPYTFDE